MIYYGLLPWKYNSDFDFQKLPFTIQELVQASPCKSSDGILYTGKK